jgi:hypothetical protein
MHRAARLIAAEAALCLVDCIPAGAADPPDNASVPEAARAPRAIKTT